MDISLAQCEIAYTCYNIVVEYYKIMYQDRNEPQRRLKGLDVLKASVMISMLVIMT